MQITNSTFSPNNTNLNFKALKISEKAIEEVEYMGSTTKKYYEKIWGNLAQEVENTKFYDILINEKLRPVFIEKTTGTELRNIRLRSTNLDTINLSADICEKNIRKTDSYFSIPNPEHFIFKTKENKLIEDCNEIIKITKALEAYKQI